MVAGPSFRRRSHTETRVPDMSHYGEITIGDVFARDDGKTSMVATVVGMHDGMVKMRFGPLRSRLVPVTAIRADWSRKSLGKGAMLMCGLADGGADSDASEAFLSLIPYLWLERTPLAECNLHMLGSDVARERAIYMRSLSKEERDAWCDRELEGVS